MPAETYLERLPELAHDQSAKLDIVYGEFRNHQQHGRPASLPEFLTRFPDLSKALSRQAEFAEWVALGDRESVMVSADTTIEMPTQRIDTEAVIDVAAPLTMDDYQLEQQLGRGGMGTVYRARQKSLDRPVAIKFLNPDKCRTLHTAVPRFLREGRAIARLKHPHIVGVHGIGRTNEGGYFLVMELVDGQDLRQFAKQGLAVRESVELLVTVAEAIAHAHARGLIHRDLKPANILIDADGRPLVTDFGLARLETDDESDALTQTNDVLGTPSYMAPEQADSRFGEVGPWTDIYGLGAMLYTLLAGRPPVSGNEPIRILSQVISDDPIPSLSAARPDVPARLAEMCDRCLRKVPAERISSAEELVRELRDWLKGSQATAPPATTTKFALGSKRLRQGAALAIAGLIVATLLVISNPFRQSEVGSPQSAASIPETVTWSIEAFRDGDVRDRISLLEDPGPLFTGDSIRIRVSFSDPTWAYLFWIDSGRRGHYVVSLAGQPRATGTFA
ncbi:MAG: serine/threonine protein kinase [Planctomycetaceae bacterium]|nr:serine/threonine protein kinase [Planctomycetales bacterium]MCB9922601.1 serine/threonine protein kinase [Planctomycetaceae bacterium]